MYMDDLMNEIMLSSVTVNVKQPFDKKNKNKNKSLPH